MMQSLTKIDIIDVPRKAADYDKKTGNCDKIIQYTGQIHTNPSL